MYLLLSMCYAELTSVVAFAGGSFGYCRAALGPFWGFLVGASEMLENFLYVVVTVMTIGSACTEVFGTSRQWEPVWYLLTYGLLVGVHLRGGELLWYTVMVCGSATVLSVSLFCAGEMEHVNVTKWAAVDGKLFSGTPQHFMEALFFPTWFYIGVEIMPQLCERVKDVNVNLPRGMVWGNGVTLVMSFWLIMAATCNAPGISHELSEHPFPLDFGYTRVFHLPGSFGALMSIIPCLSAGIGFMWGCGYQVMALARSGLLPAVCMKVRGENEVPYVNLCVSALLQYVVCVWMWAMAPTEGPHVLYETVVIGASMVYMGVFGSFIVFRYRFGAMKREWVSVAGVPGALVGMFIAMLLFASAVGFQQSEDAMAIYFVFMTLAGVYYLWYAQRTQYFSAEEQKKFMKAYILNANKKNRKRHKSGAMRMLESWFVPVSRLFGLSASASVSRSREQSHSHQSSLGSVGSKSAGATSAATSAMRGSMAGGGASVASALSSAAPDPTLGMGLVADEEAGVASLAAKADGEVRSGKTVSRPGPTESDKLDDMTHGRPAGQALRASWAAGSGSMRVGWSGKAMTMTESKKFFEVLTSATEEHVAEKLLVALPNQFVMLSEREMSTLRSSGSRAVLEVDEAVLLQELLAAENEEAEAEEDDVASGGGVAMSGVDAMQVSASQPSSAAVLEV
eukprot:gene16107-18196_t